MTEQQGSRLPEDWQPTDELRGFARDLGLDPQDVRDEFVDHWIAVPGAKGRKLNWPATFCNRCRALAGRNRPAPSFETWNDRRIRLARAAVRDA